jgi:hypothetical protein
MREGGRELKFLRRAGWFRLLGHSMKSRYKRTKYLEMLVGAQMVGTICPYGIRRFVTVLTRVCHPTLFCVVPIHILRYNFSKILFNIILQSSPRSPMFCVRLQFLDKDVLRFSFYACFMSCPSNPLRLAAPAACEHKL